MAYVAYKQHGGSPRPLKISDQVATDPVPGQVARMETSFRVWRTVRWGLWGLVLAGHGAALETPLPRKLPEGFESVIFAAPPLINYPTFVCPGEAGELFVSVDKNASLDKQPDRGFIVKLIDEDGDGKADRRTDFAKVTSPRGLAYDGEWVYCLHPPTLTRFRDTNGDGVADETQELIRGIGFDLDQRPPDHTSNGVTLALDGWLYLAIGDFGFMKATGTDGRTLQLHDGGVVRVRPDGTRMELFAKGTRNIYEVAVDPWLNVFTRDNTNDGGGWDTKVHALFYGADLGYPRKFKNFADETFPTLGIYGGGSGTGATYIQEPAVPAPFGDMLYTADWGRSAIYYHPKKGEQGAWFDLGQEVFCEIERPTNIKSDAAGNIYIASWKGGEYTYKGEDVGYIALVRAPEARKKAGNPKLPEFATLSEQAVDDALTSPSLTTRIQAKLHRLRTGDREGPPHYARVASALEKSATGPEAESYLRWLGEYADDNPASVVPPPTTWLTAALHQAANDRVKTQAVIALSRLGRQEAAPELLKIAAQAPLVEEAAEAAPEPAAATGLVKGDTAPRLHKLQANVTGAKKLFLVVTDGGNGTSVDHADWVEPLLSGPAGDQRLTDLRWTTATAGWSRVRVGRNALGEPLGIDGKPVAWGIGTHSTSVIAYDLPENHGWTVFTAQGALDDSSVRQNPRAGSVEFFVYVEALPSRFSIDQTADDEVATDGRRSLPHLASQALINLNAHEACFAALDAADNDPAIRAAVLRVLRQLHDPAVVSGLIARVEKAADPVLRRGLLTALIRLYFREAEWDGSSWGTRPDTTGPYYKKATWEESPRLEQAVRAELAKAAPGEMRFIAAQLQRHSVVWDDLPQLASSVAAGTDPQWEKDATTFTTAMAALPPMKEGAVGMLDLDLAIERTVAAFKAGQGDAKLGERLFTAHACIACHAVEKDAAPKGPNLYDIAQRYQPEEILRSILSPSATIAQGFPTHVIETTDGETYAGFIVREGGDAVVLRNMAAVTQMIPADKIKARHKEEAVSSMTPGLVNPLPPEALAGMLEYFRQLAAPK